MRAPADAREVFAAIRLANLLAERGDLDGLRGRAQAGDGEAARVLANLMAKRGGLDEVFQVLRARADWGDGHAARQLPDLLARRGDIDEAVEFCVRWPMTATGLLPCSLSSVVFYEGWSIGLQRTELADLLKSATLGGVQYEPR